MNIVKSLIFSTIFNSVTFAQINAVKVTADLSRDYLSDQIWQNGVEEFAVTLMAQPMVVPKPKKTATPLLKVKAVHNGEKIAFRLHWTDAQKSDSVQLASFSDAVAIQFPIKDNAQPPAIIMGHKDNPVHIFHWRYQYQRDAEQGSMRTVHQAYPNMSIDMYPADYLINGNFRQPTKDEKEAFSGGIAAGNPQSYLKTGGVDELMAEGFGTLVSRENLLAQARGFWKDGEWVVYIVRPLKYSDASSLEVGSKSHVAFAVWQGEESEVGGIKSLTMSWTPLNIQEH